MNNKEIINKVAERYGKMWDIKPHVLAGNLWWKDAVEDALNLQIEEFERIIDSDEIYPTDIFPELSQAELIEINANLLDHYGFPLDRLSAHISRRILEGQRKKLQSLKLCGDR